MQYKAPNYIPEGYEWIITYHPCEDGPLFCGRMRKIVKLP